MEPRLITPVIVQKIFFFNSLIPLFFFLFYSATSSQNTRDNLLGPKEDGHGVFSRGSGRVTQTQKDI